MIRIAILMGFVAITLFVVSVLHLAGVLDGEEPFRPAAAGIAEAIIGLALAIGAASLWRGSADAWTVAFAATAFAIVGFLVGLSFTLRGGSSVDIAYHLAVLPLLVVTLVALLRAPRTDDS